MRRIALAAALALIAVLGLFLVFSDSSSGARSDSTRETASDPDAGSGGRTADADAPDSGVAPSVSDEPDGQTVAGIVIGPEGKPIAQADVFTGSLDAARVLAKSDSAGGFRVRLTPEGAEIAARAHGYAPSVRRFVAPGASAGGPVTLKLRAKGGRILGTVRDPAGEAITGALVKLGEGSGPAWAADASGNMVRAFGARERSSDGDGAFEFDFVRVGETVVSVHARGFAPWRRSVQVRAARDETLEVVLAPGATIVGQVTAAGAQIEGAIVIARQANAVPLVASTSASGHFRIEGIGAGHVQLEARHEKSGVASSWLEIGDLRQYEWSPNLAPALAIRGRILDREGGARSGWYVRLIALGPRAHFSQVQRADEEGRFTLPDLDAGPFRLEVAPGSNDLALKVLPSIHASEQECEIVVPDEDLPTSFIEGAVRAHDGDTVPNCVVSVQALNGRATKVASPDSEGKFRVGPLPAGSFHVRTWAPTQGVLEIGETQLASGQTRDLGEIRFPVPARVRIQFDRDPGAAGKVAYFLLRRADSDTQQARLREGRVTEELELALTPGEYVIAWTGDVQGGEKRFGATAGQSTVVRVPLVAAPVRMFRVAGAGLGQSVQVLRVTLRNESGDKVWSAPLGRNATGEFIGVASLKPGTYYADLLADNGQRSQLVWRIGADTGGGEVHDLEIE